MEERRYWAEPVFALVRMYLAVFEERVDVNEEQKAG